MRLLLCLLLALSALSAHAETRPFTLPDLDGGRLTVDFSQGRVTLVNFWATWCLPCREEMPQIARLLKDHGGKGLRVIGVAMESGDAGEVKKFLKDNPGFGVNYPMAMGDDQTAERFGGVEAVPTTFLIDSSGKILRRWIGVTPDFHQKVGSEVARLLAASAPQAGAAAPPPRP
ncbi:MAG TPA: TlpA disulfide reductase family protein [Candidatus Polarisedimenticolia bacterium]|nr:TlpA disulfide reductase family protein [Candidatus Polarisedimenticolia bacterium]